MNSNENETIEELLRGLRPSSPRIDADELMFMAGRRSAMKGNPSRPWIVATLTMASLCAVLSVALVVRSRPNASTAGQADARPTEHPVDLELEDRSIVPRTKDRPKFQGPLDKSSEPADRPNYPPSNRDTYLAFRSRLIHGVEASPRTPSTNVDGVLEEHSVKPTHLYDRLRLELERLDEG
jgi:hypothetical protein